MSRNSNADPTEQRQAILAPYLVRLRKAAHATDLALDSWERNIVEQAVRSADPPAPAWIALVAEGIAFQSKFESDLRRLMRNDTESPEVIRAQLLTDAAVGLSLLEETQRSIDLMVLSGEIDAAKKLSSFRNKLGQAVSKIKGTIGAAAFQTAEALSGKMVAPEQAELTAPEPSLVGELPQAFIQRTRAAARPASPALTQPSSQVPDPARTKGLAVVLVALAVVWTALTLPRLFHPQPLPVLSERAIPPSPAIRELMARPPSLFIEVDVVEWNAMSTAERRQLVTEVGEVAESSGYTGVQFRNSRGNSVAQWLRSQGVWLASGPDPRDP